MTQENIAIIGAGQAGASLAIKLRRSGHQGEIVLYGLEDDPPYQRPPLSKEYLAGDWKREQLWLRPLEFWQEQDITLRLGKVVSNVDITSGTLLCGDERYSWDKLALTTGANPRPRPPEFANGKNVFELRNLADIDRLAPEFQPGQTLLVIGGGYIGLETAAVAVQAGLSVHIVEREERILNRVACGATASVVRALHQHHGASIYEGCGIERTMKNDNVITEVLLDNGVKIACDLVIVGIGVVPQIELAEAAGVYCDDGIIVDEYCRTSAVNVWAAGDCVRFPLEGKLTRLESVQNAIDQAEAVAANMLGLDHIYRPIPWFWSHQYDLKLQVVGLNRDYDSIVSHKSKRGGSHWYFRDDQLIAVDALNDVRAYMVGKKILESKRIISKSAVDRSDFDPKQLLQNEFQN